MKRRERASHPARLSIISLDSCPPPLAALPVVLPRDLVDRQSVRMSQFNAGELA